MNDLNYTGEEPVSAGLDAQMELADLFDLPKADAPAEQEAPAIEEAPAVQEEPVMQETPAVQEEPVMQEAPAEETAPEEETGNPTLAYYDENADAYYERTLHADMEEQYRFFLKYLPAGARILDFGCGSGRDTKYFRDCGYNVTPVDGSEQMCKKAESYTGISVRQMDFLDLNDREIYAGIWASASLLHIPKKDLTRMLAKLRKALTRDGIMFVSFKDGTFEGMRDGRYFTDLTEGELFNLVNTVGGLKIVASRPFVEMRDDQEVKWTCAIIKKW